MEALACLVVLLIISTITFKASDGAWCVCRSDVGDGALQKTLDLRLRCRGRLQPDAPERALLSAQHGESPLLLRRQQLLPEEGPSSRRLRLCWNCYSRFYRPDAAGTSPSTGTGTGTGAGAGAGTTTSPSTPGSTTPSTFGPPGTVLGGLGPSGNSISTDSSATFPQPLVLLHLLFSSAIIYVFPLMRG